MTITGTFNSSPGQAYTIQSFAADEDNSGYGEDQIYLGSTTTTTDTNGDSPTFTYGGGVLKMEPCEAASLPVPMPQALEAACELLRGERSNLGRKLHAGLWRAVN